jgi:tetratricopeptide (TPR) repeat protein
MTRGGTGLSAAALAASVLLTVALPEPASAQAARKPECVAANDEVTRLRLGRDRAGRGYAVNVPQAVAAGLRAAPRCSGDDPFLIAFALARIDLAKDVKQTPLESRTSHFNNALASLDVVKRRVAAGKSDRYEVFNILGLIYYDTQQFERSIAVLLESAPFLGRMTPTSRRNTFFTKGMAYYHLGRVQEAEASFATARKFGHPEAARWQAAMHKKH